MSQLKAIQDKLLTNVSNAYVPEGFISELVFPMVPSMQKSGKLGKYGTNHLRIETSIAGGRGQYRRVESITRDTDSYNIETHGLEGLVTEDDYDDVEAPFDAENDETVGLTTLIYLEKEKGLADALTNTAVLTQNTTLSGSAQFNNYLDSDPIDKFKTARAAVLTGCGFMPNLAIFDVLVWNTLRFHPGILDALGFKQNRPGGLTMDEMAVAMGVEKVLIAAARYESAMEGQTSSLAAVWGKHIIFAKAPERADKFQKSLGYRMQMAGQAPRRVFKSPVDNPPNSTKILVDDKYDQLIANVGAGYLLKDVIA